jgi:Zn-dependent metalloprotease
MKRKLTLVAVTLALIVTVTPTRVFQQGRGGGQSQQDRALPSGKIVESFSRAQGARPAWVETARGRSLAYLKTAGAAHGLDDAQAELSLLSAKRDDFGQTHVRFQQVHRGVPVFNAQLIVHLDRKDPVESARTLANGRVFADARTVSTRARITPAAALGIAKTEFGRVANFERENVELVVLPEAVRVDNNDARGATLTYKVELLVNDGQQAARHFYFVDARTGSIVWDYENLQPGQGRGLYSGSVFINTVFQSPTFRLRDATRTNGVVCGTPGIITSDAATTGACTPLTDANDIWGNFAAFDLQSSAVDAHFFAAKTFDYFIGVHGLFSVDGAGRQMCNRMRNNAFGTNNAFWDGQCTNYGQGSAGRHWASADVVGHEYTHAITEFTGGPAFNTNQSGGSNESFSDIFGTMVEFFWGVNPDYLLAEDINGAIRNMANPRSDGNSIDHLSQFFPGMDPHFSSGLQNVTFFLLSESGNHPTTGIPVKKIGRERAASVYFRALDVCLFPTANYSDVRQAVELSTRDHFSTGNPLWNAVRKAWFSAGVGGDVPFNPIDTSNDFVIHHFRDFLNRDPSAGELAFWKNLIDQCGMDAACEDAGRTQVSRGMWDSTGFQSRPDVQASGLLTGDPNHPFDNHQFIRWCYLNYLRREPDAGGWAFWEAHLNDVGDYNALIMAFLYSQEYRERFGPA